MQTAGGSPAVGTVQEQLRSWAPSQAHSSIQGSSGVRIVGSEGAPALAEPGSQRCRFPPAAPGRGRMLNLALQGALSGSCAREVAQLGHWSLPGSPTPSFGWQPGGPFPAGTTQLQRLQKSTSLRPGQTCPGEACLAGAAARVAAGEGPRRARARSQQGVLGVTVFADANNEHFVHSLPRLPSSPTVKSHFPPQFARVPGTCSVAPSQLL